MAFTAAEQAAMIADISDQQALVGGTVAIAVVFVTESEPVMFNDGTYEMGKPYCIATGASVTANSIAHGTLLEIDDVNWYVIGVEQKRSGFYHLTVSKTA